MSLNWQFTDKERFGKLSNEDKKLNDAYIWGLALVDMTEITEKNAVEFLIRYRLYNKIFGPFVTIGTEGYEPTLEDVRKRIGLRCNVAERSRSHFCSKIFRNFADDIKKEIRNQSAALRDEAVKVGSNTESGRPL